MESKNYEVKKETEGEEGNRRKVKNYEVKKETEGK